MKIGEAITVFGLSMALAGGTFVAGRMKGLEEGKASVTCPPPKVVRAVYSTEELGRMLRARKRLEAVK